MNKKELINQLESLMANQMDFIDPDDSDDIFRKDVEALKLAIKIIEKWEEDKNE